jgi:two-component system phosphate regulon sensor histidine kinase PhoR
MLRKELLLKVYSAYLVIIVLSIVMVGGYASTTLKKFYLHKTAEDLEVRARLIERDVAATFSEKNRVSLDELSKSLAKDTSMRITLILPTGEVVGDSDMDPRMMEDHSSRPEVKEALAGKTGMYTRYSETLRKEMMYVAIPARREGEVVGVVRTSMPLTEINKAVGSIYLKIAFFGLVIIIVAVSINLEISRRLSRILKEMRQGAQRFAGGDLTHRLLIPDSEELGSLADALNQMAKKLGDRMRMTIEQRNELEAVLSAMEEGVVAVDSDEYIFTINQAASLLLGIDGTTAKGHTIQEIVRNADILRFFTGILTGKGKNKEEIVRHGTESKFLQVSGTVLRDSEGEKIGALVVLNDITRLRQLENIRREFVANVSHELKTPITSIKGYIETLQEGALEDKENARKFLEIIFKQADLLHALIDDLLSLSKIEQEAERGEMQLVDEKVRRIIEAAIAAYKTRAREHRIQVTLHCKDEVVVKANARLLEQAVGNLLDNAIKYSEAGSSVDIEVVVKNKKEVAIAVRDHGGGIAPEHLSRLFERFYRVDKGRSRELGGTGLGLAIVKHIIQAHGGRVAVESTPGKGSTFTLFLPKQ